MAKNTNRAASAIAYVAALVLATGASAFHWEMYVNNDVTYAKEVFGGDDPAADGVTLRADDAMTMDDPDHGWHPERRADKRRFKARTA